MAAPKLAELPNALERAIAAISPSWALSRHQARVATAMAGGYVGASYADRFANWMPRGGDADADTVRDLPTLRARSRDLVRNSPIGTGAIETLVTHAVGTGLSMQSRIDAKRLGLGAEQAVEWQANTDREFRLWAESFFCDATEQQNFYGLQGLVYRSFLESGDVFPLLADVPRDGWPFRLSVQVIEADRVSNPDGKGDTDRITAGIERNERGAPVRAHIADRHPGKYVVTKAVNWQAVDFMNTATGRRNLLHVMRKLRPGQSRGVPILSPIIDSVKQITRYSTAEVDAAVNSAAFSLFVKMDPDAFGDLFTDTADQNAYIDSAKQWDGSVQSGKAVNLLPGEEIQSAAMARPNPNFDPFIQAFMTQIGMALNIPKEVLAKHFNASYSASRAALLDFWRTVRVAREFLATYFCEPVYQEWLADAVALGRISAPGFFNDPAIRAAWSGAHWAGDGPGAIDPEKEANAAEKRTDIGLTTLPEEIVAYDGGDFDTKHREAVRVKKLRDEAGLSEQPKPAPGAAPGKPGQTGKPQPAEDDEGEDMANTQLVAAITALASREPTANVSVHLPQGLELSIPTPVINVAAPVVNYEPPVVNVAAPIVNLEATTPEAKVVVIDRTESKAPEAPKGFTVIRDANNKIIGIQKE